MKCFTVAIPIVSIISELDIKFELLACNPKKRVDIIGLQFWVSCLLSSPLPLSTKFIPKIGLIIKHWIGIGQRQSAAMDRLGSSFLENLKSFTNQKKITFF